MPQCGPYMPPVVVLAPGPPAVRHHPVSFQRDTRAFHAPFLPGAEGRVGRQWAAPDLLPARLRRPRPWEPPGDDRSALVVRLQVGAGSRPVEVIAVPASPDLHGSVGQRTPGGLALWSGRPRRRSKSHHQRTMGYNSVPFLSQCLIGQDVTQLLHRTRR
ncbi:hypothetical protein BD413DRAFT_553463 [Trametes elegans]|nr:hypothetical protein BD413DRAFT_553463 [Trametes elegans]